MQLFDYKFALILSILIVNSFGEDRPKIIEEVSGTIERNLGENATLSCKVNNPHDFVVQWVKLNRDNPSDQTVLSYGATLVVKSRLNVSVIGTNEYKLEIQNIEFSDAAVYQCQVTVSTTYKDTRSVDLLIRYPPKIDQAVEVTPKVVPLNSSAELKCMADGHPKPSISWLRASGGFLPAGGHYFNGTVLKINQVSVQDRGIYYCIADNGIGQPAKRSVNFEVEFAPKISVPRPRVAQAVGYDIELECKVESFPAAEIAWYRDDSQIYNEDDYSITMTGTIDDITYSVLHISTVESSQYGTYVCKATNKLGSDDKKVELFAHQIPNIHYSGLQWNASSKSFNHVRFVVNYAMVAFFALIFHNLICSVPYLSYHSNFV